MLQCEPEAFFESEQCKLFSSAWLHVSATQVLMIRKHFQRALFTQGGFPSFFLVTGGGRRRCSTSWPCQVRSVNVSLVLRVHLDELGGVWG
jgi:hypothetical protein